MLQVSDVASKIRKFHQMYVFLGERQYEEKQVACVLERQYSNVLHSIGPQELHVGVRPLN